MNLATTKNRVLFTLAVTELSAGFIWFLRSSRPDGGGQSDLAPLILGARAWLEGLNPYTAVASNDFPLIYPFPAVLAFLPVAYVPGAILDTAWVAVSAALLAWSWSRDGLSPKLLVFLSPAWWYAAQVSQWSPLMVGAMATVWGSALYALKPTTGLWLWSYQPRWQALLLPAGVVLLSLGVWPTWPVSWWHGLTAAMWSISPLLLPGGPLVLLVLLRWRRPEARLLATMACVPHTPMVYEAVPLFLIPRTWTEGAILVAGTAIVRFVDANAGVNVVPTSAQWMVLCVYLPAMVMILRRRDRVYTSVRMTSDDAPPATEPPPQPTVRG